MSAVPMLIQKLNDILADPKYHDILGILKGTRNGIVYGAKLRFCHTLVMSILFRSGPFKDRWEGIMKNTKQHAKALGTFVFCYKSMLYILKLLRTSGAMQKVVPRTIDEINNHTQGGDAFIAGLVAGYVVFGRASPGAGLSSINQQMVLYVFSRVFMGVCKFLLDRILERLATKSPLPHAHCASTPGSRTNSAAGIPHPHHTKHVKGAIGVIDFITQTRRLSPKAKSISNIAWSVFASVCWGAVMYLFRLDSTLLQSSMIHSMKLLYIDSESWSNVWDFLF